MHGNMNMEINKLSTFGARSIAVLSALIFYSMLSLSIYLHPGYNIFSPHQSLSDLGMIGQSYAYIFNSAIIIAGTLFMIATCIYFINIKNDKSKKLSLCVFFIALIFYICIAFFPKGTPYHDYFALSFFGISTIAIFIWSISEFRKGSKLMAAIIISLTVIAYTLAYNYHLVGFAFAELFGGTVIILWIIIFNSSYKYKKDCGSESLPVQK